MKLVGYSFTYELSCPLKQLCHSSWPPPVSVIFGLLANRSTFFFQWWTDAEIGNRDNRALWKMWCRRPFGGNSCLPVSHWALQGHERARGQFGSEVNGQLWLSVSLLKYTAAVLLHCSWFISPTEGEVFADQSLCCYTLTINNEERNLCLVFGQVQAGYKSKCWV